MLSVQPLQPGGFSQRRSTGAAAGQPLRRWLPLPRTGQPLECGSWPPGRQPSYLPPISPPEDCGNITNRAPGQHPPFPEIGDFRRAIVGNLHLSAHSARRDWLCRGVARCAATRALEPVHLPSPTRDGRGRGSACRVSRPRGSSPRRARLPIASGPSLAGPPVSPGSRWARRPG